MWGKCRWFVLEKHDAHKEGYTKYVLDIERCGSIHARWMIVNNCDVWWLSGVECVCHEIDWWWHAMRVIGAVVSIGIATKIRCWLYVVGEVWSGLHVQLVS